MFRKCNYFNSFNGRLKHLKKKKICEHLFINKKSLQNIDIS